MLETLRQRIAAGLQHLSIRLQRAGAVESLPRYECPVLIFFHGYSLAHTIRPLVVGRALRTRGYPVEFAGMGPHAARVAAEGFQVYDVETMPQSRMDEYVSRSDYGYYNAEWIDRCVRSERALIRRLRPALALADLRPTLPLTAALEGVDIALIEAAYNQPGFLFLFACRPPFLWAPNPLMKMVCWTRCLSIAISANRPSSSTWEARTACHGGKGTTRCKDWVGQSCTAMWMETVT